MCRGVGWWGPKLLKTLVQGFQEIMFPDDLIRQPPTGPTKMKLLGLLLQSKKNPAHINDICNKKMFKVITKIGIILAPKRTARIQTIRKNLKVFDRFKISSKHCSCGRFPNTKNWLKNFAQQLDKSNINKQVLHAFSFSIQFQNINLNQFLII